MNHKKYINSKICQKCANCCKISRLYIKDKDLALRLSWLDTDRIRIKKINENCWKIEFLFKCKMLIKTGDKYKCKVHKAYRPNLCKEYPLNYKLEIEEIIKEESYRCPIIKDVISS